MERQETLSHYESHTHLLEQEGGGRLLHVHFYQLLETFCPEYKCSVYESIEGTH